MSQVFQNWVARYDGNLGGEDYPNAIVSDAYYNLYITGTEAVQSRGQDCLTLKYDRCGGDRYGNPIWNMRWGGSFSDFGNDITVNSSNEIIVGGEFSSTLALGYQYLALKYSNSGNLIWGGPNGTYGDESVIKVAVYGNHIYLAGRTYSTSPPNYNLRDFVLMKRDQNNNQIWYKFYGAQNKDDQLEDMFIDQSGNIYLTGGINSSSTTYYDWGTVKFDTNGNQLWAATYNGTGNNADGPFSLAVDDIGNVYVTGISMEYIEGGNLEGYATFTTIKYNSAGTQQWVRYIYSSGQPLYATGRSITIYNNEPYVTGRARLNNSGTNDYVTVKYNSAGVQQWLKTYNYAGGDDRAEVIKSDNLGGIYVTGASANTFNNQSDPNTFDYATIKYKSTGEEQWVMRYDSPYNQEDTPKDMQISADGIYVSGRSDQNTNPSLLNYDILSIRYSNGWLVCDEDTPGDNPTTPLRSITKINDSTTIAVGDIGLLKISSDRGRNWLLINTGLTQRLNCVFTKGAISYAGGKSGKILFSSNSGRNWSNRSLTVNKEINSIYTVNSTLTFAGGESGLFMKTTNNGVAWINLSIDTSKQIYSIFFSTASSGYIAGRNGLLQKTTNGGISWTLVQLNTQFDFNKVLFFSNQNGIVVGKNSQVYITNNNGLNWQRRVIPLVSDLKDVYFVSQDTGYICGSNGLILCTIDGGNSWQRQNTYSSINLTSIAFLDNGRGMVTTDDGRVILSNAGEFENSSGNSMQTGYEPDIMTNNSPREYRLGQNYPNPFNPVTNIKYTIKENTRVSLKVYDITGKLVSTLVNNILKMGEHSIIFDGSALASGIYYYQLITFENYGGEIEFIDTHKMVLVK